MFEVWMNFCFWERGLANASQGWKSENSWKFFIYGLLDLALFTSHYILWKRGVFVTYVSSFICRQAYFIAKLFHIPSGIFHKSVRVYFIQWNIAMQYEIILRLWNILPEVKIWNKINPSYAAAYFIALAISYALAYFTNLQGFISLKKAPLTRCFFLVPVTGLEPVRCCHRGILSPLRLPIPPHRHSY